MQEIFHLREHRRHPPAFGGRLADNLLAERPRLTEQAGPPTASSWMMSTRSGITTIPLTVPVLSSNFAEYRTFWRKWGTICRKSANNRLQCGSRHEARCRLSHQRSTEPSIMVIRNCRSMRWIRFSRTPMLL
jgi:hypothetical protein